MAKAKEIKHEADALVSDRILKLIIYMESMCYFFLTGFWMDKTLSRESQSPFNMIKDSRDLLTSVVVKKLPQLSELNERLQVLFAHKLECLAIRLEALLLYQMFTMRWSQALSNYRHITEYQHAAAKERPSSAHAAIAPPNDQTASSVRSTGDEPSSSLPLLPLPSAAYAAASLTAVTLPPIVLPSRSGALAAGVSAAAAGVDQLLTSSTPSPASSTGSSSHSLPPGLVAIPQHVETLYKQQLHTLHNLLLAHHNWMLADSKLKQHDSAFFNHLDTVCGRSLSLTSNNVPASCIYMLTAVQWLRCLHSQQNVTAGGR